MIKSSYRPGWEPPGGQVELGEDLVQALIRETKEETGYDVTVTRLLTVLQNTGSPGSEPKIGFVLEGELAGGAAVTSSESEAVGWFTPEQAMEMITQHWMKERVEDALKTCDSVKNGCTQPSSAVRPR